MRPPSAAHRRAPAYRRRVPDGPHLVLLAVGGILAALALVLLWGEVRQLRHDVLPALVGDGDEDEEPPTAQI